MRSIWVLSCSILLLQAFHPLTVAAADQVLLETELQQLRKLESTGDTAQAIEAYESLIKSYPQQAELYNNLAVLMAKEGDLEAAREYLEQAMKVDQVYATVYENLTAVYVEIARGSYASALQLGVPPQQVSLKEVNLQPAQKAGAAITLVEALPAKQNAKGDSETELDEDILLTLQGWASAWSAQEVDLYLSFYALEFKPAKGMSRARWERQRGQRLRRPAWVKITLNDFKLEPAEEGLARVRFVQHYQSDNYRDKTWKEMLLKSSSEGWRILSEHSL